MSSKQSKESKNRANSKQPRQGLGEDHGQQGILSRERPPNLSRKRAYSQSSVEDTDLAPLEGEGPKKKVQTQQIIQNQAPNLKSEQQEPIAKKESIQGDQDRNQT